VECRRKSRKNVENGRELRKIEENWAGVVARFWLHLPYIN